MLVKSSSALFLLILVLSLVTTVPLGALANAAPNRGGSPSAAPGGGVTDDAVVTTTTTVTVTSTTTVTLGPPATVNVVVHVQNQYGLWINGAEVEVFLEQSGASLPGLSLVSSGTTTNGQFIASNMTQNSDFMVQVNAPTGAVQNQTVDVQTTDALLTFVFPSAPAPSLSLENVVVNSNITTPGTPFSVTADVVNNSNSSAYNAVISLVPPPQFSLLGTGSEISLGTVTAGTQEPLKLLMSVSNTVVAAGYAIGYSLNFSDYLGIDYTVAGNIALPTPPAPDLVIQNVTLTPTVVQPGENFSLTAEVMNAGNSTAFGAVLTVTPPADISLLSTGSVISVGTLPPGSSKTLSLQLLASNSVPSTANTIAYSLGYTDYFLNKETTTGNLFVPISGNPVSPKLIVTAATFSASAIHPGENFSVPIVIQNVASVPASEVVLSVNATSPLLTTGSAGDYRLGVIAANGTLKAQLGFSSPPSAPLGSYPITLNLAYVDAFGSLYSSSQVLVVTIVGEPTLVFNELQFKANPLTPGLQTFLNAQILNSGGESALNVKVTFLDAPSFLTNTTIYLGSIQPGRTGNATSYLQIPTNSTVGSYDFQAAISYTDSTGQSYQVTAPYTVTVAPFSPPSVSITNTLMSPEVLSPGTQGTLTIYYKNAGPNPADDIILTLSNGSQLFTSTYFGLGTLGAGQSGTTTVGVNVAPKLKGGNYMVKIVATYTDTNNATYTFTLPLEVTVYGATPLLTVKNVAIGLGIVVVAVLAYVAVTTVRRRGRGGGKGDLITPTS